MPRKNKHMRYENDEISLTSILSKSVATKADCADCPFLKHGFVCGFDDASCLRNNNKIQNAGRKNDYAK